MEKLRIEEENSIEVVVTLFHNHIYDYGSQGFNDTIKVLQKSKLDYCREGYKIIKEIKEIKGIKLGILGYTGWDASNEQKEKNKNDYVPAQATGKMKEEILNKLNELSPTMNFRIKDQIFSI